MGIRPPSSQELLNLATKLRNSLPARAPMWLAERAQHCVVRLELLAEQSPVPDEAKNAMTVGESLLRTFAALFSEA